MRIVYVLTMTWLVAAAVNAAPQIRDVSTLTAPSGRYQGQALDSRFSRGMDFVGDLNGDGRDDLAIGAHKMDLDAGYVYVIFGSDAPFSPNAGRPGNLNGTNGFTIVGPSANADVGFTVSAAGDFNGDGRPDMAISSTTETGNTASIYVIFGRSSYPATLSLANPPSGFGFRVTQQFGPGSFGWSLSAADLNNDGFSDVMISNWADSQVYVVFGQAAAPNALTDVSALSTTSSPRGIRFADADGNARFGWAVRGTPDLNGDGIDDMLIGSPFSNSQNGRFNVIYGRANVGGNLAFASQEAVSVFGVNQGMQFTASSVELQDGRLGSAVAFGDINGDDFIDFIVGAQTATPNGATSAGAVYTIYGTGSNSASYSRDVDSVINGGGGMVLGGAMNGDAAGTAIGAPGDVNGDGLIDLVVSSHVAGSGKGRFYLVYGRQNWPAQTALGTLDELEGQIWVGNSLNASSSLGFSMAQSGDFNGDGLADVAVGALLENGQGAGLQAAGTAYLLLGVGRPFCNGFEAVPCR